MVWAPLSEVPQIGRMSIYILTLAVFVVLQVPTALATNYGMLMAFLTRFFGSPILATSGTTVADLYTPKKCAYGMTLWGVSQRILKAGVGQSGSSCGSRLQLSSCYSSSTPRPPRPTSSTGMPTVSARLPESLRSCPLQRLV